VDDAGVVQFVGQDRVLVAEDSLEQSAVGVPARRVEDGVLLAEEARDSLFELLVQLLSAADEANRGQAVAVAIESLVRGLDDGRMIGETEVVVGAEVDHFPAIDLNGRPLWPLELARALVAATCWQIVELRLEDVADFCRTHR